MNEQITFLMKKGGNDSERLVPELYKLIAEKLHNKTIKIGRRKCKLKVLTTEDKVMFDVVNPSDEFDHIEFNITKTGWGRKV